MTYLAIFLAFVAFLLRSKFNLKFNSREINVNMHRNDSKKKKSAPTKPGGFKRRNSTTVSSIKIKKPPKESIKSPTSFDYEDGPPLSPRTPSEAPSVETVDEITQPQVKVMEPEDAQVGVENKIADDNEGNSSANEEDLLADLNATLAKVIEKDKAKKHKKFRIVEPLPDPEEPNIE